jgi:hypothetical protein
VRLIKIVLRAAGRKTGVGRVNQAEGHVFKLVGLAPDGVYRFFYLFTKLVKNPEKLRFFVDLRRVVSRPVLSAPARRRAIAVRHF